MPEAYFLQVPEHLHSQHIKAITFLHDFMESNMSLKIKTQLNDHSFQITHISSPLKPDLLHDQIKNLDIPSDYRLSKVQLFCSFDNSLAVSIFFFQSTSQKMEYATRQHGQHYINFIEEVKVGKHDESRNLPEYSEIFDLNGIEDFFRRTSPSYIANTKASALMLHHYLFRQVCGSEDTAVSIDKHEVEDSNSSWITIAAANVSPHVLLRSCASIVSARGLSISRCHLDQIGCPESSGYDSYVPGYVTMLRLLVSPNVSSSVVVFLSLFALFSISLLRRRIFLI